MAWHKRRSRRRKRDPHLTQALPAQREQLRALKSALVATEHALGQASPPVRRLLSDAYEERSGRSFDDLLAEVHAYGERTSQVLSWGWTCKPGPAPDHLRQLLYLFVAQALEDSSIKVTEYPNGDAAHILRVVSEAATGHRPSQSGADIRKPLRWMRDYLRLGAGGVTTVR